MFKRQSYKFVDVNTLHINQLLDRLLY